MKVVSACEVGRLTAMDCGHLRLNLGEASIQLSRPELLEVVTMLLQGVKSLSNEPPSGAR